MVLLKKFARRFTKTKMYNYIPDKWAVCIKYWYNFDKKLDLKNPKTFNEKLQWLKLYDRRPEYTKMVDKYAAKEYVASIIGEEYIIPTLGVWNSFDEIDFDSLPNQFVLKTTHASGDTIICKDKTTFDYDHAKTALEKSLHTDYYLISREWPYKNVDRRIIAEKYIKSSSNTLIDYKFQCINGKLVFYSIITGRFSKNRRFDYFDAKDNFIDMVWVCPNNNGRSLKPKQLRQMKCVAEKLAKGFPELRVDLYEVDEKIYFGELTFFHASGLDRVEPEEYDLNFGSMLILPQARRYNDNHFSVSHELN